MTIGIEAKGKSLFIPIFNRIVIEIWDNRLGSAIIARILETAVINGEMGCP